MGLGIPSVIFTSHTTSARPACRAAEGKHSAWVRAHTLARGLTSLLLRFPHLQSGRPPFPHCGVCLPPGALRNGSPGFIHRAAMSSGDEGGPRLAAVLERCEVTSLGPVSLFLSFKDTTRPRKSHEKEGVEYHFVSKQAFEADLHHNK